MTNQHKYDPAKQLAQCKDALVDAVSHIVHETALSENLEQIASSFYAHFQFLVDADPERSVDPTKVFELQESDLTALHTTLRLMVHLATLYECYDRIVASERQPEKKEASHE